MEERKYCLVEKLNKKGEWVELEILWVENPRIEGKEFVFEDGVTWCITAKYGIRYKELTEKEAFKRMAKTTRRWA